jgi:hypothetical protein
MRDMSSGLQGLGKKGSYWRDGKLYSIMNDPQYGYLMPDGTTDTRWQTAPIRVGGAINEKLTDGVFGLIEGGRYLKDIDYATIPDRILGSLEKGAADLTVGAIEGGRYLKDRYNAAENWLDDKYDAVAGWYNPPWERTSSPVTSGGPLSRGNSYERYLGRMEERYRNGIPEYNTPDYRLAGPDWLYNGTSIGHGEGQVDPSFYKTPYVNDATDPMYQNRVAINADISALEKELEAQLEAELAAKVFQDALPYATGVVASHEIPGYDRMVNEGYDSWSPSDAVDTRSDWQKWKDSFKEDWKAK